MWSAEALDRIPIHFIFCTERTGSSMLTELLNRNPNALVTSEEPFALYFYNRYQKIQQWTDEIIVEYVNQFFRLFEKNPLLYFEHKEVFIQCLSAHKAILNYERLVKLSYLNFYDGSVKSKENVRLIIDKQMKYVFHAAALSRLFPNAKILFLTRDVFANIEAKSRRKIDFLTHPYYQANIWNLTYSQIKQFRTVSFIQFEDIMQHPEASIQQINDFFGIDGVDDILEKPNGFIALIEKRRHLLSDEFIQQLEDFHRGMMQRKVPREHQHKLKVQQHSTIALKTNSTRQQLGYSKVDEFLSSPYTHRIAWNYYKLMAMAFRPLLWRSYYLIPLSLKLFFRKKKREYEP